ncbi:MAG: ComF family protein [Proteobacteria bacterium]|nr:MAG: ComF family protein [Pseudomonadota bacterium]
MHKVLQLFAHVFAHRCALCDGASDTPLCNACRQDLPRLHSACPQCALPLEHSEALCADCLAHPKPFARTYCAFPYVFPVDALIHQFKNRGYRPPVFALSDELATRIALNGTAYTALVPMPQHWRGLWKRARNPAAELAVFLGTKLETPVDNLLRKTRYTAAQKQLTRKERWQNLAGSLAADKKLSGGNYLLVDDVMTTGASSILASQVLLDAGAQRVDVAILARTPFV